VRWICFWDYSACLSILNYKFSSIFSFLFHCLWSRMYASFTNAVSVVVPSKKMIPVFFRSRPAE